jgi:predicted MPP superfamily phosphohydrolase
MAKLARRFYVASSMVWSFAIFFVVLIGVLGGANYSVLRWAKRAFSLPRRAERAVASVLFGSLAVMMLGRLVDRGGGSNGVIQAFLAAAYAVQLAVLISAVLLLFVGLGVFAVKLTAKLMPWRVRRPPAPETAQAGPSPAGPGEVRDDVVPRSIDQTRPTTPTVPRRSLLIQAAAGSAFLVGSSSSLYGSLIGRHDYTIEELGVRLPGLSKALDGFSIVQLSDVHVGSFVGDAELEAGFEFVRRAKPDLVVLTGDLIDHDARFAEKLGRFVRRLAPLAREGVAAITGNHDYYAGVLPTVAALERAGARVLRNAGHVIGGAQGFALLGVDDVMARRFDPAEGPNFEAAIRSLPAIDGRHAARDFPRVLLCHNPSYFERSAGKVELQLSGHTHGGQINVGGLQATEIFMKNGWISGLYERSGSRLYVNRGFGTAGPPARVGAPPEITRVVLTS